MSLFDNIYVLLISLTLHSQYNLFTERVKKIYFNTENKYLSVINGLITDKCKFIVKFEDKSKNTKTSLLSNYDDKNIEDILSSQSDILINNTFNIDLSVIDKNIIYKYINKDHKLFNLINNDIINT
jgi:hypothetical protein